MLTSFFDIPIRLLVFEALRGLLVAFTGRGYDRSAWLNNLHHKLSFRLHKLLPAFGITGIQRVAVPGLPGKFMYVRAEDGGVAHQLIMYRQYEPFEFRLVREHLKPGMTVYNIGANLGYYTLIASECVGQKGKVFAFEPAPDNFELLQKNITENKITNVELFPVAVGALPGNATLSISATNSGDHQLQSIESRSQVSVNVISLDSFMNEGRAAPDAIIMDVQGSELDVLLGASRLLADDAPLILFTEFWPHGLDERHPDGAKKMLEILEQAKMKFHLIDEKRMSTEEISLANVLSRGIHNVEINLICVR